MDGARFRSKKTSSDSRAAVVYGNLLLAAVPDRERRRLLAQCESVDLTFGDVLCEQGDPMRHLYFPTGSFISLISSMDDRPRLEVGLIGVEGMLGVSLALDVAIAPLRAVVQGTGSALRIKTATFCHELSRSPGLTKVLHRYLYVLMSQLAQMAACTRFHMLEARLCRWLLMTRDRAHSDQLYLTQEFLAYMLGVRRAGIVGAASALQKRKLIRYVRGTMIILDGSGLEASSCSCYATARDMHARLMR